MTHQRLFSDLRLVFWVNSLEYSFSAGPQFDLIKLNSFTLYFASGPLPLCLNNNRSAAEGSSEERGSAESWKKGALMISTAAAWKRQTEVSRARCTFSVLVEFSRGFPYGVSKARDVSETGRNLSDSPLRAN